MTHWQRIGEVGRRSFVCGHCGKDTGPKEGYSSQVVEGQKRAIYICTYCDQPTYFTGESQIPGPRAGSDVECLPSDVAGLYEEIRAGAAAGTYTSVVLACRKMLMHLGVEKGADSGKSFLHYVEYLAEKGYVPPDGRGWVDHVRAKGNEANHEIVLMTRDDALRLVAFVEMLLRFIYEFPGKIPPPATT